MTDTADRLDPPGMDTPGGQPGPDGPSPAGAWPAAPRLLGLRLQGFKSFAERTNVEFGGGISAVVGPNGSGKSNLADALRWALGEQGRALRSRKAEDVIWAGSEKRAAQGMADVTLVLDNGDGLLPVDFQVLELGRRLYRSGENDYLLNKQRIRLRDLVDLLDGAHLADNAFLFIGQGMVDQALALRPEERRPLFEEVAGVRRHERRRRKAEDQLVESEANLARVDDILAELRPQARRLAAQAEQQATRSSVGDELAAALLASTHARWHESAARLAAATERRVRAQAESDRSMHELETAETAASALAAELAARSIAERERRDVHEAARAALTALQLRAGRTASDLEALGRDRQRLADERAAAETEAAVQRRAMAAPVVARDLDLEAAVTEADRELAEALAELATLRSASRARGEELAALRRAEAARQAEAETARRRLAEAERRGAEETEAAATVEARRADVAARLDAAGIALVEAVAAETAAQVTREAARATLETAEADRAAAADRAASASATVAALRGRVDALGERLADEERRPIARAARKVGGRRVDDDLAVDPELRAAVEAALDERARAYLVPAASVTGLVGERGRLLIEERVGGPATTGDPAGPADAATRRFLEAVALAGGGRLADAIRRDPTGGVRRLLARVVWAPDLDACIGLQSALPPGWIVVPRDGSAVVDDVGVALGAADSVLERRAEHARLAQELERVDAELATIQGAVTATARTAEVARASLETARSDEARLTADRRRAEETERAAARESEAIAREVGWHEAQRARLDGEVARLREAVTAHAQDGAPGAPAGDDAADVDGSAGSAVATWERRAADLRDRRDRLAAQLATHDAARRDAEHRRARAEASASMADDTGEPGRPRRGRARRARSDAGRRAGRAAARGRDRHHRGGRRSRSPPGAARRRCGRSLSSRRGRANGVGRARTPAFRRRSGPRRRPRRAGGAARAREPARGRARRTCRARGLRDGEPGGRGCRPADAR